ncbi:MAG: hypothetical protein J6D09_05980 [Clostridia bacterium]|nr:hypothetical protein [Clostridia bacterium]
MKHNFLKKLTALLLGTIMVFSMIPAIAVSTHAADEISASLAIKGTTGVLASDSKSISWTCNEFTWTTNKNNSSTAIRTSDSAHFRVYVGNKSTITAKDSRLISKIVITAVSGYVPVSTDVKVSGATTTTSGTTVTISLNTPATSVELPVTSKQWRLSSVEVFFITGDLCDHNYVEESRENATCTEDGSVTYVCSKCEDEKIEILKAGHIRVNGVCTVCGESTPVYEKVKSTLTDFTGRYLIVYEAGNAAFNGSLTTLDAISNTFDITKENDTITGDFSAYEFIIGGNSSGYTIQSASGMYIGKTANSNGLDANASTEYTNSISIDASGNAIIKSSGGSTLQFNADSNQMRFRYYKSVNQKPIALYKLVEVTEPEQPEVEAPAYKGFGLTLNKGVTVRVKFNVTAEWLAANPTAKAVFSNGEECDVIVGENTFTTTLTPGKIGENLTVTLGDVTKTVSVSTYIEKAKAAYATDTKLCTLLDAIDAYGKAAAKVEQTLTAPDFDAIADHVVTDKSVITGFTNVVLAEYATIGLNINAEESYTFEASRGTATTGKMVLADNLDNGVLYIENIRPANFDDVITVTIYDGDTVVSTIDFTFNSYLKLLANDENMDDLDRNIVIAAYNYGVAASAYVGA